MMNIELLNKFFVSSLTRQLCLVTFFLSALFAVSYYLIITPINLQHQQEQSRYDLLQDELKQLIQRASVYPGEDELLFRIGIIKSDKQYSVVSSIFYLTKNINDELLHYELKLIDFAHQEDTSFVNLKFKIGGPYSNFIKFLYQLSELRCDISLTSISIMKEHDSLFFLLNILVGKGD